MAITYPRALPADIRWLKSTLSLPRGNALNRLSSGALQAAEVDEPLWRASFVSEPLVWSERRLWEAWERTLRGGIGTFLAYDWVGSYPLQYGAAVLDLTRAGGGSYNGTATFVSCTATTLTLSGLPNGYQAKTGDRLSFAWNNGRAYHEVAEDAVASSGGALTVTVEPYVRAPYVDAGTDVALVRAPLVLQMDPDTWSSPDDLGAQRISFTAVQVI
ncbi:hypothetical protein J5J86_13950 [Aquabacter sp. L1I39]|uniref:hypothetical protein n=1 Tax=Aquabacter sp. L1I39 TaxID=2820278 RepID=UPI001ADC2E6B|nr:hypothetical protein [Aquabacter sp. L1I39]QTL01909.1 hypothetical protein J5J86_13950 [Aquabacter sp. L1I39]